MKKIIRYWINIKNNILILYNIYYEKKLLINHIKMSIFLNNASKEQKEIINLEFKNNEPVIVIAWAWSWKTTTIINHMWYKIEQWINAENILALSFSNKSAKEIWDRVKDKIKKDSALLQTWTFHSLALNLLKSNIPSFKNIKILDKDDDKSYIKKIYDKHFKEIIKKLKIDLNEDRLDEEEFQRYSNAVPTVSDILWVISRSKNTNENVFDIIIEKLLYKNENVSIKRKDRYDSYKETLFSSNEYDIFKQKILNIYGKEKLSQLELFLLKNIRLSILVMKEYEKSKYEDKYMSFDDLLINIVEVLYKDHKLRKKIDDKYKYVYVDEFQDINFIQFEFLKLINKDNNYMFLVGDADQAIYSFRWCDSYYFNNMKNIYPNTVIKYLEDNYRSDGHIVWLANSSIENNTERYKKTMNNIKEPVNIPTLIEGWAEHIKYKEMANIIYSKWKENYKNTAILYRNNTHSLQVQKAFIEKNIPFKVVGWTNILNRKYSKDIRSLLSLTIDLDFISLVRAASNYPRVWAKKIEKLDINIKKSKYEWNEYIEQLEEINKIKELKDLYNLLKDYNEWKIDLDRFLSNYINDTLYNHILSKVDSWKISSELDNLEVIKELIVSLHIEWKKIDEILDDLTLDNIEDKSDENVVTLSTIHRSKWLEWNDVYIVKCYNNVFPSFKSKESRFLLEEERNLFYVAVTRAKENLSIVIPDYIDIWFDSKPICSSEFVDEIIEFLEKKE